MLNAVQLIDFCNHKKTRLNFGRMTALVGQNGSGKTSVMRALELLQEPNGVNERVDNLMLKGRNTRQGDNKATLAAAWDQGSGKLTDYALLLSDERKWFSRK